jgi:hypothetical protein
MLGGGDRGDRVRAVVTTGERQPAAADPLAGPHHVELGRVADLGDRRGVPAVVGVEGDALAPGAAVDHPPQRGFPRR